MEAAWREISATIEGTRLRAKRAVDEAVDFNQVDAVLSTLDWPTP